MASLEALHAELSRVLGLVDRNVCHVMRVEQKDGGPAIARCSCPVGHATDHDFTPMDTRAFLGTHMPDVLAYVEHLHQRIKDAEHHHPDNREDIATAIKRAAAELAEVLPESTIGSDLWRATVWQADHYDATHAIHEREDGYRRETQPIPQQTVIMGNATFGPMTITMPRR